jgi:hypothetical protein
LTISQQMSEFWATGYMLEKTREWTWCVSWGGGDNLGVSSEACPQKLLQEDGFITGFGRKCVVVSLIHCQLISQLRLLK